MADTVNRFPELMESVEKTASERRAAEISALAIAAQAAIAIDELRDKSPGSSERTLRTTGHAPHHIAESWLIMSADPVRGGARAVIGNSAPHLSAQRYGIEPVEDLSAQGPWGLTFWTGSPLRWPSKRSDGQAGWMRKQSVDHPGFGAWGGSDFVERAAQGMRPEMAQTAVESGDEIAFGELRPR